MTSISALGALVIALILRKILLAYGMMAGAAIIHAGATVLDHLPHGSFFHATGGSVNMQVNERLKLIPYKTLIGLTMAVVSTVIFGVFGFDG